MRDYGKVSPRFWTGETGRKIREAGGDAQRVALYLLTCPMSSMTGLYYLSLPTIAHEVGMTLQGASKALASLSEAHFAYWDEASEVVFVPEMAAHQIGDRLDQKDNRVKGVIREWMTMRKCRFFNDFYERYKDAYHLPEPSPSEAPYKPLRSQEQEQEQEQEHTTPSADADAPRDVCSRFAEWWAKYPRKAARRAAEKAWESAIKHLQSERGLSKEEAVAILLAAVTAFSGTPKATGAFCPHAATWLNQGRYDDDPSEWQKTDGDGERPKAQATKPTSAPVVFHADGSTS